MNHSGTSIYLCRSEQNSPLLLLLCLLTCLANAGPIVVNILYMYTIRQACCGSHVFHHCFNLEQSNSNCCLLRNLEVKTCYLYSSESSSYSHPPRGSIYHEPTFDSYFRDQSPWLIYSSCKQLKEKKAKADPRHGVISYMNLLCFNQPTRRHLISMLMSLEGSLLVQRCLYAVWLERNNNAIPIRGWCKSPIPMQHSSAAPDRASLCPI